MTDPSTSRATRRTTLASMVGLAAGLAGCTGGGGSEGGDTSTPTQTSTATSTQTPTSTATSTTADSTQTGDSSFEAGVDEWVSDTSNYEGSVVDETGQSELTVVVGAQGNDGNFAFAPPAIEVSTGTTVIWEWNGKGGQHNVVDQDGAFSSELTSDEGYTFEHAFESAGTYRYYCEPHKSLGMKGIVVVQ